MIEAHKTPKERAVAAAGGVTKLADAIGVTRSAVSQWGVIPMDRVFAVAGVTGIPAHELRPDLIPAPQDTAA